MDKPKAAVKNPKILQTIKDVAYYEKKLSKEQKEYYGLTGKKKKKSIDPITKAYKESSKSPKKMFKESMAHLHSLLKK